MVLGGVGVADQLVCWGGEAWSGGFRTGAMKSYNWPFQAFFASIYFDCLLYCKKLEAE